MKLLIKTYNSNEYWDCDHLLLSITPEQIAAPYAHRDKCVAALNELDPDGWGGNVGIPLKNDFDAQFGNLDLDDLPDTGRHESDMEHEAWTLLNDDASLSDDEYERTECVMLKVTRDGEIWITALVHYCEGKVECQLHSDALAALCQQPQSV